jgi:uncharacterized RDD family membrane protein YckC
MQERNPYAPTRVPLVPEEGGSSAADAEEFEVAGFWRRFGAQFIDGIIMLPLTIGTMVAMNYSRLAYAYMFLPTLAIGLFYQIYLVRRFGGTPGKRICSMRIVMSDMSAVTVRAAALRYSVIFVLSAASSAALAFASLKMSDAEYLALGYFEKIQALSLRAPAWESVVTWCVYLWILAGIIVMLSNRRRRATHDFIARTVVIRTEHLE